MYINVLPLRQNGVNYQRTQTLSLYLAYCLASRLRAVCVECVKYMYA